MPSPNTTFELTVEDMDLIETALRTKKKAISSGVKNLADVEPELKDTLHGIQDLLGRLHNQKEFYRPRSGAYVGG